MFPAEKRLIFQMKKHWDYAFDKQAIPYRLANSHLANLETWKNATATRSMLQRKVPQKERWEKTVSEMDAAMVCRAQCLCERAAWLSSNHRAVARALRGAKPHGAANRTSKVRCLSLAFPYRNG